MDTLQNCNSDEIYQFMQGFNTTCYLSEDSDFGMQTLGSFGEIAPQQSILDLSSGEFPENFIRIVPPSTNASYNRAFCQTFFPSPVSTTAASTPGGNCGDESDCSSSSGYYSSENSPSSGVCHTCNFPSPSGVKGASKQQGGLAIGGPVLRYRSMDRKQPVLDFDDLSYSLSVASGGTQQVAALPSTNMLMPQPALDKMSKHLDALTVQQSGNNFPALDLLTEDVELDLNEIQLEGFDSHQTSDVDSRQVQSNKFLPEEFSSQYDGLLVPTNLDQLTEDSILKPNHFELNSSSKQTSNINIENNTNMENMTLIMSDTQCQSTSWSSQVPGNICITSSNTGTTQVMIDNETLTSGEINFTEKLMKTEASARETCTVVMQGNIPQGSDFPSYSVENQITANEDPCQDQSIVLDPSSTVLDNSWKGFPNTVIDINPNQQNNCSSRVVLPKANPSKTMPSTKRTNKPIKSSPKPENCSTQQTCRKNCKIAPKQTTPTLKISFMDSSGAETKNENFPEDVSCRGDDRSILVSPFSLASFVEGASTIKVSAQRELFLQTPNPDKETTGRWSAIMKLPQELINAAAAAPGFSYKPRPFKKFLDPSVKTYKCSFEGCPKRYSKSAHLKAHLRRHTGEWLSILFTWILKASK